MDLILWRHAEAEDGIPDEERKLTDRGIKQAARVTEWLLDHLPKEFRVVASPAKRTQQTAMTLTREFETSADLAVGTTPERVLDAAGWPNAGGTVIVVGHQPTLGEIASALLGDAHGQCSIKKGAVWWFTCRDREVGQKYQLRAVISPDFL